MTWTRMISCEDCTSCMEEDRESLTGFRKCLLPPPQRVLKLRLKAATSLWESISYFLWLILGQCQAACRWFCVHCTQLEWPGSLRDWYLENWKGQRKMTIVMQQETRVNLETRSDVRKENKNGNYNWIDVGNQWKSGSLTCIFSNSAFVYGLW